MEASRRNYYLQQVLSNQSLNLDAYDELERDWNNRFNVSSPHFLEFSANGIDEQLEFFKSVHLNIQEFWTQSTWNEAALLDLLWCYWLPLAQTLAQLRQIKKRPIIQGILGGQGTGKTTLTHILRLVLGQMELTAASLSLDDLYKTYAERQRLRDRDPRLIWRGPPGTHDVQLGIQILDQVLEPNSTNVIQFPIFDKYSYEGQGDRTGFQTIKPFDILLFEGWFVGLNPIAKERFENAPDPIVTECDRQFAQDMNAALEVYIPLWERLDSLWVLNPVDYRLSQQWRWEAESQAIASGRTGMTEVEVYQFVSYFWKALHPDLFIQPLIQTGQGVDWVIEIDASHQFQRMFCPH